MKKKLILGLIALIAFGYAAAKWYTLPEKQVTKDNEPETITNEITLEQVATNEGDYQCIFEYKSGKGSGIIYISEGKFRADYKSSADTDTHMAYDGEWYYAWGGGSLPFKIPKDEIVKDGKVQTFSQTVISAVDPKNTDRMVCLHWKNNQDQLLPPTGMEFIDSTEIMKSMKDATDSGTKE